MGRGICRSGVGIEHRKGLHHLYLGKRNVYGQTVLDVAALGYDGEDVGETAASDRHWLAQAALRDGRGGATGYVARRKSSSPGRRMSRPLLGFGGEEKRGAVTLADHHPTTHVARFHGHSHTLRWLLRLRAEPYTVEPLEVFAILKRKEEQAQEIENARLERERRRQRALRHAEESTVGKKVLDYFVLSQTVHDEDAAQREQEAVLKRSEEGKRLRTVLYARACQLALDQLEHKARFPRASQSLPPAFRTPLLPIAPPH